MATKAIRDRMYTILNTLTAVPGTVYTVAPRIPRGAQDYEGYILYTRMVGALAPRVVSQQIVEESAQWSVELLSPALNIGFDSAREDAMYDYRDAILDLLMKYPRLESAGSPLDGVSGVAIGNERFQTPYEWAQTTRALWQVTLTISGKRIRQC
jgi:hypothetical protein